LLEETGIREEIGARDSNRFCWLRAELEEVGRLVAQILAFGRRRSGERCRPVLLLEFGGRGGAVR
jgi:hypothetical protein